MTADLERLQHWWTAFTLWCLMHLHPWHTPGWSKPTQVTFLTQQIGSAAVPWALHHCPHHESSALFRSPCRLLRTFVIAMCVFTPSYFSFFLIESTGVDSSSRRAAERRGCVTGQRLDHGLWPMSKIWPSGACVCVWVGVGVCLTEASLVCIIYIFSHFYSASLLSGCSKSSNSCRGIQLL